MSTSRKDCRPWSAEETERLCALAAEYNKAWHLIGPVLDRSAEACKQKFNEEERHKRQKPLPMRRKTGADGRSLMKSATDVAAEARRQAALLPPRSHRAHTFTDWIGDGFPWRIGHLDSGLLKNGNHRDRYDGRVWWTGGGTPFWLAFFWWDNSIDQRGASNSGFYVLGFDHEHPQDAFDYAATVWPEVIARQKHPLVLQP